VKGERVSSSINKDGVLTITAPRGNASASSINQVPILPNAHFPILHIFVRFSHKYVYFCKFAKNRSYQICINICTVCLV
jgi:hypothetical protein